MPRAMPPGLQIAPSLLSADFAALGEEIRKVADAGARWLQLDVMDGHFVPNITFGPAWAAAVRRVTDLYLDAHLMVTSPSAFVEAFARAGVDLVTVHAETAEPVERLARQVREHACAFGLAFRPGTDPLPLLERHGEVLDLALIMTVEPGFGGQDFRPDMLPKIQRLREWRDRRGLSFRIQVDGGITPVTARQAARAGAESLVAGSAIFGRPDPRRAFRGLEEAARAGERERTGGTSHV